MDVSAVAVVVGATVWIEPPTNDARFGMCSMWSWNWSHPRPSRTSRTHRFDSATGAGIHDGNVVAHDVGPKSAGTMPRTLAPA